MLKRFICVILSIALFLSVLPTYSRAETEQPKESTTMNTDNNLKEIVSERDEYSKTFVDDKGNFTKEIYAEPIHTKVNGKWEEISTKLKEDKTEEAFKTELTKLEATYPKKMDKGKKIKYRFGKDELTFLNITASDGEQKYLPNKSDKTKYEDNKIMYEEVFPGINLRHVSFNNEVKEDWIIKSYQGINEFNYEVATRLTPRMEENGSIGFYKDKKFRFMVIFCGKVE